jgi:hypothetical protein
MNHWTQPLGIRQGWVLFLWVCLGVSGGAGSAGKENESCTALKDKEDVAWVLKQRIAGLI